MRDDIKDLIAQVKGDDPSARQNAIIDLMYKVEDSTRHIHTVGTIDDKYLSQDEQLELIYVLIELAESLRPEYAGLLWVVSKADPIIMVNPVQNFVLKYAKMMQSDMLQQSIVALENCLCTKDFRDFAAIKAKFKYEQLKATLHKIKPQDDILGDILSDTLSNMEVFYTQ